MDTLGMLPDRELPQFDAMLVARIADGGSVLDARLLERYASAAVAADVAAIVGAGLGRFACEQQAALLAYLLRAAPREGEGLLARAIATRSPSRCYQMTLGAVARLRMTPGLERLALAHLEDDDPGVVTDAAETLGKYGSAVAQTPLRARFERWSQAWAGRADDLRFSHARDNPHTAQEMLERALLHALGQGHGWLTGELALREIATMCVTDSCIAEAGRMADAARPPDHAAPERRSEALFDPACAIPDVVARGTGASPRSVSSRHDFHDRDDERVGGHDTFSRRAHRGLRRCTWPENPRTGAMTRTAALTPTAPW